jgi:hypothetical protein
MACLLMPPKWRVVQQLTGRNHFHMHHNTAEGVVQAIVEFIKASQETNSLNDSLICSSISGARMKLQKNFAKSLPFLLVLLPSIAL